MKLFYFIAFLLGVIAISDAREARCLKNADPGICFAHIIKFFFNAAEGKCKEFIYGGCSGNDNRFATKAECEAACN